MDECDLKKVSKIVTYGGSHSEDDRQDTKENCITEEKLLRDIP